MRRVIFPLLLLLLASCSPRIPANTGIEGQVLVGPMCPVVQQDQECPDQPYQAALTVLTPTGSKVTVFTTDTEGRFRIPLAPGTYVLHPESPQDLPLPVAAEQTFTVVEGLFTQISVIFDNGIR
jgi:hypothetical protein